MEVNERVLVHGQWKARERLVGDCGKLVALLMASTDLKMLLGDD